jgi:hypothetical protein
MEETHGYTPVAWAAAKEEARAAMIEAARVEDVITYGQLVAKIKAIHFEPHDFKLFHLLGQVSSAESRDGRGMLTAVVVTAEDNLPGQGFFNLAKDLGFSFTDQLQFWTTQLNAVYRAWKRPLSGA